MKRKHNWVTLDLEGDDWLLWGNLFSSTFIHVKEKCFICAFTVLLGNWSQWWFLLPLLKQLGKTQQLHFLIHQRKKSYLTAVWDIEHIYKMVIMLIASKWDCCVSRAGQESRILFPAHVCRSFFVFCILRCAHRHKVGDSDHLCQVLWNSLLRSGVSGWHIISASRTVFVILLFWMFLELNKKKTNFMHVKLML